MRKMGCSDFGEDVQAKRTERKLEVLSKKEVVVRCCKGKPKNFPSWKKGEPWLRKLLFLREAGTFRAISTSRCHSIFSR